jgi:hypothetical protein
MAGKIHSGGTVHFRLRGDRRVVRRDGAKILTVDRRPCAARLQRSLFPSDRLARAPGKPIEFEKGKNAIAVPSFDKIPFVINILITAVRNGDLDDRLAQAKKPATAATSRKAA